MRRARKMMTLLACTLGCCCGIQSSCFPPEDQYEYPLRPGKLGLDNEDHPNFVYVDESRRSLRYGKKVANSWAMGAIVESEPPHFSCVLNIIENVPVVLVGGSNRQLGYYHNYPEWEFEVADLREGLSFTFFSAAATAGPSAHFLLKTTEEGMVYLTNSPEGVWSSETVETDIYTEVTLFNMAVDNLGRPHICYYTDGGDLRYSTRSSFGWETEDTGIHGPHASCAIRAAESAIFITYTLVQDERLLFVSKENGSWSSAVIEPTGRFNGLDMATSGEGTPHICYYDSSIRKLKYAVRYGGEWLTEIADAGDDVGIYCSLAIDSRGEPHVIYKDAKANQMKYAARIGGGWQVESIAETLPP